MRVVPRDWRGVIFINIYSHGFRHDTVFARTAEEEAERATKGVLYELSSDGHYDEWSVRAARDPDAVSPSPRPPFTAPPHPHVRAARLSVLRSG